MFKINLRSHPYWFRKMEKAYCTNTDCPFKDCDRHISHTEVGKIYDFADFAGTCRRYITWLVKEKVE